MKRITITIETTSEAFHPSAAIEAARILRKVASELSNGSIEQPKDSNDNIVGRIEVEE